MNNNINKDTRIESLGCGCLFWIGILFLFISAHVVDDIVHGRENLVLGFGIPFWLMGTFGAICSIRLIWYIFPKTVPRRSLQDSQKGNWQPVGIALLIAAVLSLMWSRSPLPSILYDSTKIIMALILAATMLGFIYRIGGLPNTGKSLFFAIIAGCIAFLIYIMIDYNNKSLSLSDTWNILGMIGVPYTIIISLYDSYKKMSQQIDTQDIKPQ